MPTTSVFARYEPRGYPFRFRGTLHVDLLAGGTPSNPDVAEAWIRSKAYKGELKDALLSEAVAEVMAERGLPEMEAITEVAKNRHLTGFKRDPDRGLYVEGRQLKACVKEAASVAADAGKLKPRGYGETNARKGIISFFAEHIFVVEQRLYLGAEEPTDVIQSFVHTFRGSGIQYTEVIADATVEFTVETDKEFKDEEWALLWLTAQRQGLGACRSQGFGRFTVTAWERVPVDTPATDSPEATVRPLARSARDNGAALAATA